jgi:hypothetical protein
MKIDDKEILLIKKYSKWCYKSKHSGKVPYWLWKIFNKN